MKNTVWLFAFMGVLLVCAGFWGKYYPEYALKRWKSPQYAWTQFVHQGDPRPLIALGDHAEPFVPSLIDILENDIEPRIYKKMDENRLYGRYPGQRAYQAAEVLGFLRDPRAVEPLVAKLESLGSPHKFNDDSYAALLEALARIGTPRAAVEAFRRAPRMDHIIYTYEAYWYAVRWNVRDDPMWIMALLDTTGEDAGSAVAAALETHAWLSRYYATDLFLPPRLCDSEDIVHALTDLGESGSNVLRFCGKERDIHASPQQVVELMEQAESGAYGAREALERARQFHLPEQPEAMAQLVEVLLRKGVGTFPPIELFQELEPLLPMYLSVQCVESLILHIDDDTAWQRYLPDHVTFYELVLDSLYFLTGRNFGADTERWRAWWEAEGKAILLGFPQGG